MSCIRVCSAVSDPSATTLSLSAVLLPSPMSSGPSGRVQPRLQLVLFSAPFGWDRQLTRLCARRWRCEPASARFTAAAPLSQSRGGGTLARSTGQHVPLLGGAPARNMAVVLLGPLQVHEFLLVKTSWCNGGNGVLCSTWQV